MEPSMMMQLRLRSRWWSSIIFFIRRVNLGGQKWMDSSLRLLERGIVIY